MPGNGPAGRRRELSVSSAVAAITGNWSKRVPTAAQIRALGDYHDPWRSKSSKITGSAMSDCKIDGIGAMKLKSEFVKKA